jgi:hypothetical protein
MGARWYDPEIGHFISADTLIPGAGNPLALDRFSYVYYNPLKYTDPSGHVGVITTDPMIRGTSNTPLGGQPGYSSLNIDKSTEVGPPPWDHSDIAPIPESGSHDLDFWAEHVGLEPGEIHEVFNPYQFSFPDTNMEFELNDEGMELLSDQLYGDHFDSMFDEAVNSGNLDNPLNDMGINMIKSVDHSGARILLSSLMVSRMNSVGISMFLDELGLNKDNEWNWEPTWVAALMGKYPDALENAMWRYIRKFKNNAEFAEARKLTFSKYETEQEVK